MSFITPRTALPGHAEKGEAIFGYTNSASLAFWDAYLKVDAREVLPAVECARKIELRRGQNSRR
jgi:hypothetical protein